MSPCELTSFITAVANIVSKGRSAEELGLLAAMLTQLADTIATIAVLKGALSEDEDESAQDNTKDNSEDTGGSC